jgi:DNA-binding beta-propeller fold protein YncE
LRAGAPIPVGSSPLYIAVTPNGAKAYVVNQIDSVNSLISFPLSDSISEM